MMRLGVLLLLFLEVRGFAVISQPKISSLRLASKSNHQPEEEISRRRAAAIIAATGIGLSNNIPPADAFIQNVKLSNKKYVNLVPIVEGLEVEYQDTVNSNGAPEKHIPKTTVSGINLEVAVPHVMDPEKPHFIEYVWLKDITNNKVLKAKQFAATDPSPPTLKTTVKTKRITVKAFAFCNLHGLWQGEEITL